MLKNENFLEEFKKSLTVTTKSISKNDKVEVSFTKELSSIDGNSINLTEPNIESIKKNLTYIRAEADVLALEFRFHSKEIHNKFIDNSEKTNEIFNAVEQSRIEAIGSISFKGIKSNIIKKHISDLKKNYNNSETKIAEAFKYVSFEKFLDVNLGNFNENNRNLIKKKLGKNYEKVFSDLKKSIDNQIDFGSKFKKYLEDYGIIDHNQNAKNPDDINQDDELNNDQNNNTEENNQKSDENNTSKIDTETTSLELQQSVSMEESDEMGEDSTNAEIEYFPKVEKLEIDNGYKSYTKIVFPYQGLNLTPKPCFLIRV